MENILVFAFCFVAFAHGHTILEEYFCKDANIEYNKSLRGGNAAGLFDNHGPTKTIQECAMKCCEAKKCNVAVMDGRSKICMGVRCFNTSSCETVPAMKGENDLQIAHISSKNRGNIDPKTKKLKPHETETRCPHNEIMYNVKLAGGLQAGKFTDIGRVKSIMTCMRYCCGDAVDCDLAFMLGKRCYLVKCYSEDSCLPLPASDYGFQQKMAYVSPWLFEKKKKIVKVPSGLQRHHMQCTQSKIYTGSKLLGGTDAGKYTHVGKVGKMHICSRLCCEDQNCDLAYMFGKDCFQVKCYSEKGCRVIPDEEIRKATSLTFDKQVQYIVKRQYGVKLDQDGNIEKKNTTCRIDGGVRNSTVLNRGMLAGKLKTQHGIEKMNHCIERCCKETNCNVALMLGKICYSMECSNADSCKPKPAPDVVKNQNPVVAYVKRGTVSMAPSR